LAPFLGDAEPFDPAPVVGAAPLVLLWGADHYRARLPDGGSFLCWDKSIGLGPADSFADAEFAWTNVPRIKRTVHRQLWKGIAARGADKAGGRVHVSQKPRELMRWCLGLLGLPRGSLVADPYMGSGSTGIAALEMGHRFVGVEIDPGHFHTACQRIEAAQQQATLFEPAQTVAAEQHGLFAA
jgi:site-specific DNA-methyltransferase (adenine-specific)/modification methylase